MTERRVTINPQNIEEKEALQYRFQKASINLILNAEGDHEKQRRDLKEGEREGNRICDMKAE